MAFPKAVLVTGGNNGIGYETVKALLQSEKAYRILLGSRSLEKAKLAIETLRKECPESTNTIQAVQVDITSDESIEKAFAQVKASPGYLDALINNAGMHTSLVSCGSSRRLKSARRHLRPRIRRWQDLSPRLLHQSLRRERCRHTGHNLDVHAALAQVGRPPPHLRRRSLPNRAGK